MGHRPQVDLKEAHQPAAIVIEVDPRIRRDGPPAAIARAKRLAGLALAGEGHQAHTLGQHRGQRDVEAGQRRRVRDEGRIRLAALAATRRRPTAHQRVATPRRPQTKRRRATIPIGASAADEIEATEAGSAVAKGASRDVVQEKLELALGDDALLSDDAKNTKVQIRHRGSRMQVRTSGPQRPRSARNLSHHTEEPHG